MDKTIKKSIVFVIPALAFYLLFIIFPLFSALRFSLFKWNGVVSAQFIGFDNFVSLFKDEYFIYVLKNTFIYVVFGSIGVVVGGLLTALIINANIPGHRIFKTLYFLPVVMSAISVGLLWRFIFNYDFGIINNFLNGIGLSEYTQNWLGNTKMVIYYVIGPVIWQYIGLYMVIFYSGIKSIPVEYFESVNIDGASVFQKLRYITLPLLKEITFICFVLSSTGLLRSFDHIWALTKGGPNHASEVIAIYMYNQAFMLYRSGRAMAVSVIMFLIGIVITLAGRRFTRNEDIT